MISPLYTELNMSCHLIQFANYGIAKLQLFVRLVTMSHDL